MRLIYLDVCCLNRPFDDQTQERVHLEAEAILAVLASIQRGKHELISSDPLLVEIAQNPDLARRHRVRDNLRLATHNITVGRSEAARARELGASGLGAYDALHLACAEAAGADVLLTTDDRFIRKVRRLRCTKVPVCGPLHWVAENKL